MRTRAVVSVMLAALVAALMAAPVAAQEADACPYGWSTETTVWFGPPRVDSEVPNPERADGCTLLDVIWQAEPFSTHGAFLDHVTASTREFQRAGLLSAQERGAILNAAARTHVGGPRDDSIPNTCDDRVALTFDDGPSFYRTSTLETLRDKQVPTTFFDVGMRVDANPQFAAFQVAEGHLLLNHTQTHPNLNQLIQVSEDEVRREVLDAEAAYEAAGAPLPFLAIRPPFLAANANVRAVLADLGYTVIGGNIHASDWLPDRTAQQLIDDVVRQLRPGGNIFLHDGPIDTVAGEALREALPEMIDEIRARGYCFGTFDSTGAIVADRFVSSGEPIPEVVNPVPYLPLLFGGGEPPEPYVIVEP